MTPGRCSNCDRAMRQSTELAADRPRATSYGGDGLCATCYGRKRRGRPLDGTRVANTTDEPCVPVHTYLRPSTYRELAGHAAARNLTVAELLSKLADASLKPADALSRHKRHVRLDADDRATVRRLAADGVAFGVIAARFDVSVATVRNIAREVAS